MSRRTPQPTPRRPAARGSQHPAPASGRRALLPQAYLRVLIVTFPTHEVPDERFILVHLGQADPAGRQGQVRSGRCPHACPPAGTLHPWLRLASCRMTGPCTRRCPWLWKTSHLGEANLAQACGHRSVLY